MADFNGTVGDDTLTGGDENDTLNGDAGNDTLLGGAGDDQLNGGDGNDSLQGERPNQSGFDNGVDEADYAGNDIFDGGDGWDSVQFSDSTIGVTADLTIAGPQDTGHGLDTFISVEALAGSSHGDTLIGDDGANFLWGYYSEGSSDNNDTISGNGGDDNIAVGIGSHIVDGGADTDTLYFNLWTFGPGVEFSLADQGSSVVYFTDGAGTDYTITASNFENLTGSAGNDVLGGDAGDNLIAANFGFDTVNAGAGNDTIYGDSSFQLVEGVETLFYFGFGADDILNGGEGNDTIYGEAGNDTLNGDAGNDTLLGGAGDDQLNGGDGTDTAVFSGLFGDQLITAPTGDGSFQVGGDSLTSVELIQFDDGTFYWDEGAASWLSAESGGNVADGYVAGATVFIDDNGNNQLDDYEPFAITDANGNFTLVSPYQGTIIAVGGTNIDTGLPNTLTLSAPDGATVVNPLTTIIAELVEAGADLATAEAQVKAAFGIDPALDLTNTDLIATSSTDPSALDAQKVAASVAEVLGVVVEAGGEEDAALAALVDLVETQPNVDLTDPIALASVVSSGLPEADGQAVQALVDYTDTVTTAIEQAQSLDEISATQGEPTQVTVMLSKGDETYVGTAANEVIDGGKGDDNISGGAGDDVIVGGRGDDIINGGAGVDTLSGGRGTDTFVFDEASIADGSFDTITDYKAREDEIIDLSDLIDVSDGGDPNDFVRLSADGSVEIDQSGSGENWTKIAAISAYRGEVQAHFQLTGALITVSVMHAPPVAIDLGGDGFDFVGLDGGVSYDYDADGHAEATAWIGASDGILAFDANGDGTVTDASEFVFGGSRMTDLEAIASIFDTNSDGLLSGADEDFSGFGVWQDLDQNGVSDEGEFSYLTDLGIAQLSLTTDGAGYVAAGGDVEVVGTASYTKSDGSTADLADVMLATSDAEIMSSLLGDSDAGAAMRGTEDMALVAEILQDVQSESAIEYLLNDLAGAELPQSGGEKADGLIQMIESEIFQDAPILAAMPFSLEGGDASVTATETG